MKDKAVVAFLVDGSFYPIRNGTDYSIVTLMNSLSNIGGVSPQLLLNWRGWDNPKLYLDQAFRTIFIPSQNFYEDNGILEYAMSSLQTNFIHIYNAEEVVALSERLQAVQIKVIYEAVNIDHILYKMLGDNETSISRIKALQVEAMSRADYILCRSEVDKTHILNMGINMSKVSIYRGAIDVNAITFRKRKQRGKNVVFLGHMYYPPNEKALDRIVTHILPGLQKIDKTYRITILGNTPKATLKKYATSGIIFKNGVDDLDLELANCDIAIAPLFEGSGTRLKLLDFMASGIPTIGSTLSIEGLQEDVRECLIVEDSVDDYAQIIHSLVSNRKLYNQLSDKGRDYVEKYYDWSNNLEPFLRIYRNT